MADGSERGVGDLVHHFGAADIVAERDHRAIGRNTGNVDDPFVDDFDIAVVQVERCIGAARRTDDRIGAVHDTAAAAHIDAVAAGDDFRRIVDRRPVGQHHAIALRRADGRKDADIGALATDRGAAETAYFDQRVGAGVQDTGIAIGEDAAAIGAVGLDAPGVLDDGRQPGAALFNQDAEIIGAPRLAVVDGQRAIVRDSRAGPKALNRYGRGEVATDRAVVDDSGAARAAGHARSGSSGRGGDGAAVPELVDVNGYGDRSLIVAGTGQDLALLVVDQGRAGGAGRLRRSQCDERKRSVERRSAQKIGFAIHRCPTGARRPP
ncbi:hypothetical protein EAO27_10130 [Sphingopyxis sp. YF1]|uniref:hypothetical protein n=1 Tax=Sphingopyxis sp. YF1 TaxID=2482763 RepID=UPI001F61B606|nr:hypothetical protein [Sphingopyxis sp. YF1]UNU43022.1 hypothetical protein EAO27_10130 [Sphingopyxis sp. YF1]